MEVESHQFASQNIVCDTRPVNIFSIPILQSRAASFIGPTLQTGDRMFGLWWKAETGDPYSSSALCRVQWCAWQEGCKGSNKLPCMCRACYWASHTQTPNSTFIPPPHYTHHTHFTFLCFALKRGEGKYHWYIIQMNDESLIMFPNSRLTEHPPALTYHAGRVGHDGPVHVVGLLAGATVIFHRFWLFCWKEGNLDEAWENAGTQAKPNLPSTVNSALRSQPGPLMWAELSTGMGTYTPKAWSWSPTLRKTFASLLVGSNHLSIFLNTCISVASEKVFSLFKRYF